jgi:hypothetical protein
MRIFECSRCHHAVFFESVRCVHCGAVLAYLAEAGEVRSIEPVEIAAQQSAELATESGQSPVPQGPLGTQPTPPVSETPDDAVTTPLVLAGPTAPAVLYRDLAGGGKEYKLCANSARYGVCNAALPADSDYTLCEACRLNAIIPDLSASGALDAWQSIERAKRRLLYTLHALTLPIGSGDDGLPLKLTFSFMSDSPDGTHKVLTGHDDGHITLNIAEANAPFREKLRQDLGEGYRTLLGHFRHEIGHFYWDALVKESAWLEAFRALFGDEQADYDAALELHYESGPHFNWHERYVSAYATMHPWEDWAETWAHYLHIVDTLDTARSSGVTIKAEVSVDAETLSAAPHAMDPHNFKDLLAAWVPLTVTLNSLNRSMGLNDPYPFVLSEAIARKLHFVHDVIHGVHAEEQTRAQLAASWLEGERLRDAALLPGSNDAAAQQVESGEPDRSDDVPARTSTLAVAS